MPGPFSYDAPQIVNAKCKERKARPGVTTKPTMCSTCDMYSSVVTQSKNGRGVRVRSSDNPNRKMIFSVRSFLTTTKGSTRMNLIAFKAEN